MNTTFNMSQKLDAVHYDSASSPTMGRKRRTKWTRLDAVPQFDAALLRQLAAKAMADPPQPMDSPSSDASPEVAGAGSADNVSTPCAVCASLEDPASHTAQRCSNCGRMYFGSQPPGPEPGGLHRFAMIGKINQINEKFDVADTPLVVVLLATFAVSLWSTTRHSAARWDHAAERVTKDWSGRENPDEWLVALNQAKWDYFHDFMLGSGIGLAGSVLVLAGVTLWLRFPRDRG